MRTKEKKIKEKQKGKRQISVITVMMFVFLVFVMSTITVNSIKENLMYEDTELVTVKVRAINVDTSNEEFEEGMKNLNVYARNPYTNEELSKLTFLEKGRVAYHRTNL